VTARRPVVEVIAPSSAPHLQAIAAEIRAEIAKRFEALPAEALQRLHREGARILEEREAFDRLMREVALPPQ
jgi:hypothetical protein